VRDVPRILFTLLVASLMLSAPSVSGAGTKPSSGAGATTEAASKIVLRGRKGIQGPWRRYLWLKLVRGGIPVSFSVCAVWNQPLLTPACQAAPGKRLPEGTTMRLEQSRKAVWKRVGLSTEPALEAVLSNDVSGNRLGTVFYRVTLRQPSGRVLRTSNTFRVVWHK
jgi:hypothetical protein